MNDIHKSVGDRDLWAAHIQLQFDCALGLFKVPTHDKGAATYAPPLFEQYMRISANLPNDVYKRQHLFKSTNEYVDVCTSRSFFETSHFDEIALMIGYDSNFVIKTFEFIQEAITLEKKLFDMCKKEDRRTSEPRRVKSKNCEYNEVISFIIEHEGEELLQEFQFSKSRRVEQRRKRH